MSAAQYVFTRRSIGQTAFKILEDRDWDSINTERQERPAEPQCDAASRLVACVAMEQKSLFDEPPRSRGCIGALSLDWSTPSSILKHHDVFFEGRQPLLQPKSSIFGNDPVPPPI